MLYQVSTWTRARLVATRCMLHWIPFTRRFWKLSLRTRLLRTQKRKSRTILNLSMNPWCHILANLCVALRRAAWQACVPNLSWNPMGVEGNLWESALLCIFGFIPCMFSWLLEFLQECTTCCCCLDGINVHECAWMASILFIRLSRTQKQYFNAEDEKRQGSQLIQH